MRTHGSDFCRWVIDKWPLLNDAEVARLLGGYVTPSEVRSARRTPGRGVTAGVAETRPAVAPRWLREDMFASDIRAHWLYEDVINHALFVGLRKRADAHGHDPVEFMQALLRVVERESKDAWDRIMAAGAR